MKECALARRPTHNACYSLDPDGNTRNGKKKKKYCQTNNLVDSKSVSGYTLLYSDSNN